MREVRAPRGVNIALTALFAITFFLFLLSFSISLPIINRWFYYIQIGPLGLEEASGHTFEEIKAAYDEVLDYLLLPGKTFGTGVFAFSESGAAHFADCRFLFILDVALAGSSFGVLAIILALHFTKVIKLGSAGGHSAAFWTAIAAVAIPLVLGALIAADFDNAFRIFHSLLFPGKDNWLFDPRKDEIINVLPEQFFMNCAIFIGAGLVFFSALTIVADCVVKRIKNKRKRLRFTN